MKPAAAGGQRHLAIVGMMGSGKSVSGNRAAQLLDRWFVDLDQAIVKAGGAPIAVLFETLGEAGFRDLEAAQLSDTLDTFDPIVLACGGGVILSESNRSALKESAHVVWLRAEPATLSRRVGTGAGRPLLDGGDIAAELSRISREREAFYGDAADSIIDVDRLTLDEVARSLAESLRVSS
jgi:shikimate kinase